MTSLVRIVALSAAFGLAIAPSASAGSRHSHGTHGHHDTTYRLTLLHNNDGESKYIAGDSIAGYGGVTRFKTVLDRLRSEADSYTSADIRKGRERKGTVVISSGDNFLAGVNLRASFQRYDTSGLPFYDSLAMTQLGYDAITIGNHEFDFGPTRLAQFISGEKSRIPFLSANTDMREEPVLQALRRKHRIVDATVVRKGKERIGVIGVSPPETPSISSPGKVKFSDQIAAIVNAEAAWMTGRGIDKIILSSHLQNAANERAVVAQLKHVDIVIAGGGDELLANPGDLLIPNTGTPVGPYPFVAQDSTGANVPVVTTQGEYRYVGRLTVTFDTRGRLISTDASRSGPVRVSATPTDPDYAAEDAELKATVADPLLAYRAELANNVIGTTDVLLDGGNPNPVRLRESNLGDLVADGFRDAANRNAAAEGRPIANVAFSNGGGIRTSIAAGNISEKQTFDVLPFDNVIVTVPDISAARLKELMEWGVAALPLGNGRFPQISGFSMTVQQSGTAQVQDAAGNVTTPGTRIRSITLDDGTRLVENGAVVAGAPAVNIATTNFTANGGDSYPFRGAPWVAAGVPYQQSLYDYIVGPLGGVVSASQYPLNGTSRIQITP
jgi:5'-nucleotidase/UDP-sugar diphosphatase